MILLNESSTLEFSVDIQNTSSKLEKASLVVECVGYEIYFPISLNEDKAIVKLPILENIVPSGKNNIRMEMLIGNSLYIPFTDKIEFYSPPTIKVESFKGIQGPLEKPVIIVDDITKVSIPITESKSSVYQNQFDTLIQEAFSIIKEKSK